jgi:hypothetical protein
MLSFTRLPLSLTIVASFFMCIGEPASAAEGFAQRKLQDEAPTFKRLVFTLTGMLAPSYSNPTLDDGHSIPRGDGPGFAWRLDGRFQPLPWLGIGLGGDYLATNSNRGPVRHLGLPILVAFTPLRTRRFELGAALGLGPAWGWYENSSHAVGGSTLRSSGALVELRAEGGFPITPTLSVQTTVGYRRYGEKFGNGDVYASYGIEAPATALDFGIGARLRL